MTEPSEIPLERSLNWGETPFTHMDVDELRLHAARLYAALELAHSRLTLVQEIVDADGTNRHPNVFERPLSAARQALMAVRIGYPQEAIYRNFFRYASQMLFEPHSPAVTTLWLCHVDGSDDSLRGVTPDQYQEIMAGPEKDVYRLMTLADFEYPSN